MSKSWKSKEAEAGKIWERWWPLGSIVRVPRSGADRRTIIGASLLQTADLMAADAYFAFSVEVKAEERGSTYNTMVQGLLKDNLVGADGTIWIKGVKNSQGKIVPWLSPKGRPRVIQPGDRQIQTRVITKGKNKGKEVYSVQVQNKPGWEMTEILQKGNQHFTMGGGFAGYCGYFEQSCRAAFASMQAIDTNRGYAFPRIPIVCMTRNHYPWWTIFPDYMLKAFGVSEEDFQVPVIRMPKMEGSNCRAYMCSLRGFHQTFSAKHIRRRYWVAMNRQDRLYSRLCNGLKRWVTAFDNSLPF